CLQGLEFPMYSF
nr:immunoglobulin light chain junction region [Macaca mulatta]MOW10393.1 immunoglobulin light chain junction region [Macaca mulatta]MOW13055.1 immunoglobulin light chain junction region [Macaca mulatta]MOW13138.1 immunoglobulin light chain junction region [Macaca mulatta]MOW13806.1 immunoglobulin light chain junction region [Macaca mulatta]